MKTRDTLRLLAENEFDALFDVPSEQEGLKQFFGPQNFQEILALRRHAYLPENRSRRDLAQETILIVPGFMGSELSIYGEGIFDKIWLDFWRILARGRLFEIAPGTEAGGVRATGVLREYYYKMKVGLEAAGNRCFFYPYDWRQGLQESGAMLAQGDLWAGKSQPRLPRYGRYACSGCFSTWVYCSRPNSACHPARHSQCRQLCVGLGFSRVAQLGAKVGAI